MLFLRQGRAYDSNIFCNFCYFCFLHFGNCRAFNFNAGNGRLYWHHVFERDKPFNQNSILKGWHFNGCLVALNFEDGFATAEFFTRFFDQKGDAALFHGFAQTGQRHLDYVAHDGAIRLASHRAVSEMSCGVGTAPRSREGETGIGISSPATRSTGSSR